MTARSGIISTVFLALFSFTEAASQPVWMKGTPSVVSTGPLSITINYGLDRTGTIYIIVYNYENLTNLSSLFVRSRALLGPGGSIAATKVISVRKADIRKVLQTVIDVPDPGQIHTLYIVAADSKSVLQRSPVRLTATTLPCQPADAGPGGDECDLNFALHAVPVLGTGIWSRESGPGEATFSPDASAPDAVVTVTAYGSYTFRWTEIKGGCTSADNIVVNFYEYPAGSIGPGGDACGREFTLRVLTSSGSATGRWAMTSGSGSATFSPSDSSPTAVVAVSDYGTKVFNWTMTNGVCTNSLNVTVNFYQQPVADAGTGGSNCGLEYSLNAMPSTGTGQWTRVSGPGNVSFKPDAHTYNANVTVSSYGAYVFRWTETNGPCESSSLVSVGFLEELSASGGNGGDVCTLDFQFNAEPQTGTCTWIKVAGPGNATFTPDAHQYNASVKVSEPGAYDFEWSVINNTCSSADIVRVTFHPKPQVSAGPDVFVCAGNSISLHAEGSGSFEWSPAGSFDDPFSPDPVASPLVTTDYTVTITDQWRCTNSDQVRVEVRSKPEADAGPDQALDYTAETNLNASQLSSGETGEWTILHGAGTFTDKNDPGTRVTGLILGENEFLWNVSNGVCSSEGDTVLIRVNELLLPSMMTPNLDGKNDFFVVKGMESLGTTAIRIFNRWGALVYSDDDYRNNWDGRDNKGNPLPEDTYYYVLNPEKHRAIKGYIVIKK
ncbi:MAG: gliding motility-associated C-terminal domain-containing protein [Bacteroidales bacterium]